MFTANASAAIDPHLRLKDAELDGVDAEVIFGILGVLPVSAAGEQAKDSPAHRDDHAGHFGVAGRRARVEDQRPSRNRFREYAVEHESGEVDV